MEFKFHKTYSSDGLGSLKKEASIMFSNISKGLDESKDNKIRFSNLFAG